VGCNAVQLTVYNAAGSAATTLPCGVVVEVSTGLSSEASAAFALRQEVMQLRILPRDLHQDAEVQLLDAGGRMVMRQAGRGERVLHTDGLAPGLYTVVVVQNGARSAQAAMLRR